MWVAAEDEFHLDPAASHALQLMLELRAPNASCPNTPIGWYDPAATSIWAQHTFATEPTSKHGNHSLGNLSKVD